MNRQRKQKIRDIQSDDELSESGPEISDAEDYAEGRILIQGEMHMLHMICTIIWKLNLLKFIQFMSIHDFLVELPDQMVFQHTS